MDLDAYQDDWPLDPNGFLAGMQRKSSMVEDGFRAGLAAGVPGLEPKGLLFAGMGGSGIGANLVKDAATRALETPFTIVKHYQFPHHVDPSWHALAVSHSGATEETLAVAREAKKRGIPMTTFSTGGELATLGDRNVPQAEGYQPRQTVAHSWFSILGFLEGSGVLHAKTPVAGAVAAMQEVDASCGPHVPEARNEAKLLARKIHEKIPQIYTTPAFWGVGKFFRAMLNENAKKIAGVELVPECNHNDMTGWGDDPNRRHFTCVTLSHADQNPQIQERLAYMRDRYTDWDIPWHHHVFRGIATFEDHVIEQARAVQFLDYASFYTAMLRGVDPSQIREILGLKARLRGQTA